MVEGCSTQACRGLRYFTLKIFVAEKKLLVKRVSPGTLEEINLEGKH